MGITANDFFFQMKKLVRCRVKREQFWDKSSLENDFTRAQKRDM